MKQMQVPRAPQRLVAALQLVLVEVLLRSPVLVVNATTEKKDSRHGHEVSDHPADKGKPGRRQGEDRSADDEGDADMGGEYESLTVGDDLRY